MSVALISMLLILGVMPWLLAFFLPRGIRVEEIAGFWHPWFAISVLLDSKPEIIKWEIGLLTPITLITIGFVLLADLNRRITKAWRLPRRRISIFSQRPTQIIKRPLA